MPQQTCMSTFERASLIGMGVDFVLYFLARWLALSASWQGVLYAVLLLGLVSVVVVGLAQALWWLLRIVWGWRARPLMLALVAVAGIAGTVLYVWASKTYGWSGQFDFAFGSLLVLAIAYRYAHQR